MLPGEFSLQYVVCVLDSKVLNLLMQVVKLVSEGSGGTSSQ
jgi:hypothetical protein